MLLPGQILMLLVHRKRSHHHRRVSYLMNDEQRHCWLRFLNVVKRELAGDSSSLVIEMPNKALDELRVMTLTQQQRYAVAEKLREAADEIEHGS
jgi:hypothetical protein